MSAASVRDERIWDALRLAEALSCSSAKVGISIFLIGDAVNAARKGQEPAKGFYNIEKMLADLVKVGVIIYVCRQLISIVVCPCST